MAVDIDDAGRDPASAGVNHLHTIRHRKIHADPGDCAVLDQHIRPVQARARAVQYGGAGQQHIITRQRCVAAGIGVG